MADLFEVRDSGGRRGQRLVATVAISAGRVIWELPSGPIVALKSYRSVQVGPDQHIENIGELVYLNHSCQPNVIIDLERALVLAARDIALGDELGYFYPSTEWDLSRPFTCLCGAPGCIGEVRGARYLPVDAYGRYFINPLIRRLAREAVETPP